MSPSTWVQWGLSCRDTASISPEASTSVIVNRGRRWLALWPPPLPSSRTSRTGRAAWPSRRAANADSSVYSSGGEISGHHAARSE